MHLLYGRYARSGYGSAWFLRVLSAGFVVLAVWGGMRGDWLVLALAVTMSVVALCAVPATRRLSEELRASQARFEQERRDRDG